MLSPHLRKYGFTTSGGVQFNQKVKASDVSFLGQQFVKNVLVIVSQTYLVLLL
jgi:hypothetical protein